MPDNFVAGQPGIVSDRTATPRRILFGGKSAGPELFFPGGVTIDGTLSRDLLQPVQDQDVLQAGLLMGKVTASGKYAPAIVSLLTVLHDTSATPAVVTVGVAAATEIARTGVTTISLTGVAVAGTGPVNTETDTIVSVDTGAGTITVSGAFTNDYDIGAWLGLGNGAEVPRMIVEDEYGLRVTNRDKVSVDIDWSTPLYEGTVDVTQVLNYGTDLILQEFLKTTLRTTVRTLLTFNDDFIDV